MSNTNLIQKDSNQDQQNQVAEINPMRLVELAISQNADVDKLERLMAMQERFEANKAVKLFNEAMSEFQSICPRIKKSKQGHGYKYATLGDIQAQIKDAAKQCGLSWRWESSQIDNDLLRVKCIVTHTAGHSQQTESQAFIEQPNKMQSRTQMIGVATTYAQRYSLIGALGISTADEDMDARLPDEFKEIQPVDEQTLIQISEYLSAQGRDESKILQWLSGKAKRQIGKFSELSQKEADSFLTSLKAQERS